MICPGCHHWALLAGKLGLYLWEHSRYYIYIHIHNYVLDIQQLDIVSCCFHFFWTIHSQRARKLCCTCNRLVSKFWLILLPNSGACPSKRMLKNINWGKRHINCANLGISPLVSFFSSCKKCFTKCWLWFGIIFFLIYAEKLCLETILNKSKPEINHRL